MLAVVWLCLDKSYTQNATYGIFERTGQYLPGNLLLLSEDSTWVTLDSVVAKPTLLSFVYFKCPGLCSPLMDGMAELIEKSSLMLGADYQIVTIGIDPSEPLSLAREKKLNYLRTMEGIEIADHWKFFKADSHTIHTLTGTAGWYFKKTGKDFAHAAATLMITPDLMISQYFYGTFILPMHFEISVAQAARGEVSASRMKDPKFCLNYPHRKTLSYRILVTGSGIAVLAIALFLFIWLSLKPAQR